MQPLVTERGEGLEMELIAMDSDLMNHTRAMEPPGNLLNDGNWGASRFVNAWKFWKGGTPRGDMEAPSPSTLYPMHLFCLVVPMRFPL